MRLLKQFLCLAGMALSLPGILLASAAPADFEAGISAGGDQLPTPSLAFAAPADFEAGISGDGYQQPEAFSTDKRFAFVVEYPLAFEAENSEFVASRRALEILSTELQTLENGLGSPVDDSASFFKRMLEVEAKRRVLLAASIRRIQELKALADSEGSVVKFVPLPEGVFVENINPETGALETRHYPSLELDTKTTRREIIHGEIQFTFTPSTPELEAKREAQLVTAGVTSPEVIGQAMAHLSKGMVVMADFSKKYNDLLAELSCTEERIIAGSSKLIPFLLDLETQERLIGSTMMPLMEILTPDQINALHHSGGERPEGSMSCHTNVAHIVAAEDKEEEHAETIKRLRSEGERALRR